MSERYEPPSAFLKAIIAEEIPLAGDPFAEVNLARLVDFTQDPDRANRDWAVLLLSQEGGDTPLVRDALQRAARDEDEVVRAEAILGLAERDPLLALPLVQEALGAQTVVVPALEAAAICAHPSLIADLRVWAEPSGDPYVDKLAAEALAACERVAASRA